MGAKLFDAIKRTGERLDIRGRWSLEPAYPVILDVEALTLKEIEAELRLRGATAIESSGVRVELSNAISPYVCYLLICDAYEYQDVELIRKHVAPGWSGVVLGAGIGFTAAALALHSGSRVVAVEANPDLEPLIRRTSELNQIRCEAIVGAVGAPPGAESVQFFVSEDFWASSLRPDTFKTARSIQVRSLEASQVLESERPEVVLIDIGGAERALLQSMAIGPFVRMVIIEIRRRTLGGAGVGAAMNALWRAGFELVDGSGESTVWRRS